MQTHAHTLQTQDGIVLHYTRWLPAENQAVRGIIQIVHGMAEHVARYARFAEKLCAAGFAVYAHDQRGHGRTGETAGQMGHYADQDGWQKIQSDIAAMNAQARADFPNLKLAMFAHSMGSMMTQYYVEAHSDLVDGIVFSATDGQIPQLGIALGLIKAEHKVFGKFFKGYLGELISFKTFNKAIKKPRTGFDWLSRDAAEVDKYIADPWCGFRVTTQFWVDFLSGVKACQVPEWGKNMPKDLPILTIAGSADPVSRGAAGPEALLARYRAHGLNNLHSAVYHDARHELLNETCAESVMQDVLAFYQNHIFV